MIDKLHTIITRYDELADLMSQPGAMQDMKAFTKLAREHSGLTELVEHSKIYIYTYQQLQEDEEILNGDDPELKELVKDEIGLLKEDIAKQEEKLKMLEYGFTQLGEKDFGTCARCTRPIPLGRLLLMPQSIYCVHCAR
mgnify:CR=1 FL=1